MNDMLNQLLVRLGESLGIGPLECDSAGALGLAIDGQVLGLQQDGERERLLLYADLGALPAGTAAAARETLLIRMLQGNLFGRLAADGALALAPDSRDPEQPLRIVLWQSLDFGSLELTRLERTLRQLADTAADWREALPEWTELGADSEREEPDRDFNPALAIRV